MVEKKSILVTGSTAIDQTGYYDGSFEAYQAQFQVQAMNASFQLGGFRTSYGGCAPNIAYGLHLLGADVYPLSSAGRNFHDGFAQHLTDLGLNIDYITVDEEVPNCASCLMINDNEGNQVIGFYPGPDHPKRHLPSEMPVIDQVALAILGPEEPELTLRQGRDLRAQGIPLVVDPGQVTSAFNRIQSRELLELASCLIVNEQEHLALCTNAELDAKDLRAMVPEVVVTHGEAGVVIDTEGQSEQIKAVPNVQVVDVTGSGDAFRAGYCFGLLMGYPPRHRGELGCIMAMRNLESQETLHYVINLEEAENLRASIYG